MIARLADFAPDGVTCGVGLALEDGAGRFVLCAAGSRYRCPLGQRYFMGIGGHREDGETWLDCARREAAEEVGAEVAITDAGRTWHLTPDGAVETVRLADRPRPLALYERRRAACGSVRTRWPPCSR
jgi:8-oxo-dGTP pyrophosphatase MutT (NUDIX family)